MEPFILKITISSVLIYSYITITEGAPFEELSRTSVIPDWSTYNSFEPEGPGTYTFGYDVEDPETNNIQFRDEQRFPNGTVKGSYGYLSPNGMVHIVHYTADKAGYRATFENYPRGHLKPVNGWNLPKEDSSALSTAIQSKSIYKKQRVQEQRLRPVNARLPIRRTATSVHPANNISNMYNRKPTDFSRTRYSTGIRTQNLNPYGVIVKKY